MQNTLKTNLRLGIFVSIGLLLFIIGIYAIGQRQQLFGSTFRVSGIFKDINGLQIGNNVRFSGLTVGIIEDIEQITDTSVRVDMVINENSRKFIKKNAKAFIGSEGLMGNKIVLIVPVFGCKDVIAHNDVLETARQVNIDDILIKLKVTSDNAATITDDMAAIFHNIRRGKGTVGKLFMDSVFAQNLDKSLVNIKDGTGGFKKNMDAASHNVLLRGFFKKKKEEDKPKK